MNLIFGMKVIYLMRLDSLVKIVVERCTRNTTKVPTVWNINYQIIKNNNTTTQKKASGCFPRCFSYIHYFRCWLCSEAVLRVLFSVRKNSRCRKGWPDPSSHTCRLRKNRSGRKRLPKAGRRWTSRWRAPCRGWTRCADNPRYRRFRSRPKGSTPLARLSRMRG